MQKQTNKKPNESFVVVSTNAVVNELTMVIQAINTFVTSQTVLNVRTHRQLANITIKISTFSFDLKMGVY
jgi:hypothetical protein